MDKDIFGNLTDWGTVLDEIENLRQSRSLDAHQAGLVRILRYRDNWKLRETVLECLKDLIRPNADLVDAVWDIMMDETVYYEQRILAADGLGHLCEHCQDACGKVLGGMRRLLDTPHAPFFHNTLQRVVQQFEARAAAPAEVCQEART